VSHPNKHNQKPQRNTHMINFKTFKKKFQAHFNKMAKHDLYLTDVDPYEMWDKYLESFPAGSDPIYKERTEHDCQCCKAFVRNYGNVVAMIDGEMVSIWDVETEYPYNEVCEKMSAFVKTKIKDKFFTGTDPVGSDTSLQQLESGQVKTWDHFHVTIPPACIVREVASTKAPFRANKDVFLRSVEEITLTAAETVIEITDQGSLYRGEEYRAQVKEFIRLKKEFDKLKTDKDNWAWTHCHSAFTRIRNTAIGTLLVDLSKGEDIERAVGKFEAIMAPANYKRPKTIFTKAMVKAAEDKLNELGLGNSLGRRFAKAEDITVNNVLFVNRDTSVKMGSPFDALKPVEKARNFDKVEEIGIEDFISKVLPTAENIRLMVENRHTSNLMSLIAPEDADAKTMFKWGNNFSWAYNGDVADSMKERVKAAGGKVDGVLRYSIQWNDEGKTNSDYDAHCREPFGNEIFFGSKLNTSTGGNLDVDIQRPANKVAVENITWPTLSRMRDGEYKFWVRNYSKGGGVGGFSAEIEYDGETYSFSYPHDLRNSEDVQVATVKKNGKGFSIAKSLPHSHQCKNLWGIDTGKFVEVDTMMLSPNYWDERKVGNKHFFFMLRDCVNDNNPRGFFNEFLGGEFEPHKRVFEALGGQMKVADSTEQLSGLGFSSTVRNSVVAEVEGKTKRVLKINF
jgi:hypothetical protein